MQTNTRIFLYKYFLERDKTNRYRTYEKQKIIAKLWDKQNILISSIEMRGNEAVFVKDKLYSFAKIFNKAEYYFSINISTIAFHYKNYIYIDLTELKEVERCIDKYWKKVCKSKSEEFKKISRINKKTGLMSNQICKAVSIKFNILLKSKYHKTNNYKNKGSLGNYCQISDKELNISLGYITSEITRVLQTSHYISKHKKGKGLSEMFKLVSECVLGCIFYVAKELKWIASNPILNKKQQEWGFKLNPY
jgi:hypothetical protein